MFGKKRQPFSPYEDRADELLYKVWEERDRVYEKTTKVITRLGVIDLYPRGRRPQESSFRRRKSKTVLACSYWSIRHRPHGIQRLY